MRRAFLIRYGNEQVHFPDAEFADDGTFEGVDQLGRTWTGTLPGEITMTSRWLGFCGVCGNAVWSGQRFDMERHVGAADLGAAGFDRLALWHRDCNPRADHSKDGVSPTSDGGASSPPAGARSSGRTDSTPSQA